MVKVNIYKNSDGKSIGFKLKGHAGYNVSGKDIVCSATSILVINTCNAIEQFTDDGLVMEADEKKALIKFKVTGEISEKTRVLLDALELGLKELGRNYSKYISITFKEV